MALDILVGLQSFLAGAMVGIVAARFLLPIKIRDALWRLCHDVIPSSLLPHQH
jgi:hypothetical protein